jgi:hypothetical protein
VNRGVCFCGCHQPAVNLHHVTYYQHIRKAVAAGRSTRMSMDRPDRERLERLTSDPRNLVPAAFDCHGAHHSGAHRYALVLLPDCAFVFAAELLGAAAHDYLARRYAGADPRLDALLDAS